MLKFIFLLFIIISGEYNESLIKENVAILRANGASIAIGINE